MAPKPSQLRAKLEPYGLGSPSKLAGSLHTSKQYAQQLLSGKKRYGIKIARRIAKAIGLPVGLIVEWQENGR